MESIYLFICSRPEGCCGACGLLTLDQKRRRKGKGEGKTTLRQKESPRAPPARSVFAHSTPTSTAQSIYRTVSEQSLNRVVSEQSLNRAVSEQVVGVLTAPCQSWSSAIRQYCFREGHRHRVFVNLCAYLHQSGLTSKWMCSEALRHELTAGPP